MSHTTKPLQEYYHSIRDSAAGSLPPLDWSASDVEMWALRLLSSYWKFPDAAESHGTTTDSASLAPTSPLIKTSKRGASLTNTTPLKPTTQPNTDTIIVTPSKTEPKPRAGRKSIAAAVAQPSAGTTTHDLDEDELFEPSPFELSHTQLTKLEHQHKRPKSNPKSPSTPNPKENSVVQLPPVAAKSTPDPNRKLHGDKKQTPVRRKHDQIDPQPHPTPVLSQLSNDTTAQQASQDDSSLSRAHRKKQRQFSKSSSSNKTEEDDLFD